jgi:hypothetical protein
LNLNSIKTKIQGKKVYIKIHSSDQAQIYAFSDPELINKKLKSKKMTFFVDPDFYQGNLITIEEALNILKNYPNANIIGRLAYYAAKVNIVNKKALLWIHDEETDIRVPYILLMKF